MNTISIPNTTSVGAPAPSAPPPTHLVYLEGVRGFAVMVVILFHALLTYASSTIWTGDGPLPPGIAFAIGGLFRHGRLAVDLFIVLSGFCLMMPVARSGSLRGGALAFYKRRARRILPPYYAALAISLPLALFVLNQKTGTVWDASLPVTKFGVISHLLLIHDISTRVKTQICHPMWSIAIEWHIYFFLPLLIFCFKRYGEVITGIATIALSALAAAVVEHTRASSLTPQYLGLFTMGLLGAVISYSPEEKWRALRQKVQWVSLTLILLAVTISVIEVKGWFWVVTNYPRLDFLVGSCCALILITASQNEGLPVNRFWEWKPLVALGRFSYSIYLVHAPIQQLLWQFVFNPMHLEPNISFALYIVITTPIVVGLTYLFHLAFEKPWMTSARLKTSGASA